MNETKRVISSCRCNVLKRSKSNKQIDTTRKKKQNKPNKLRTQFS